MNKNFTLPGTLFSFFFLSIFFLSSSKISAQKKDTSLLFGLTKSGLIYKVNSKNAHCGSPINPSYDSNDPALEANGLGYDSSNKSFYYFKRNFADSGIEFISFNSITNAYALLATPPITGFVYRASVAPDGNGYYCTDINSNLFYYNIAEDAWTLISSNFTDEEHNNVSEILNIYSSGDIAFDQDGNLWILCSTGFQHALYKVTAPVPEVAVDTIYTQEYIKDTSFNPHLNYTFGGIAFNNTGQIYLSTGSPDNQLYLLQNDHSLLNIGTLSADGAGTDLTSDNYPVTNLPVNFLNFDGVIQNNTAQLKWSTSNEINNKGFEIEKSTNAETFTGIGFVNGNGIALNVNNYTFSDPKLLSGDNYYRLKQIDMDGKFSYSSTIKISFTKFEWSILGNPSNNMWMQLQLDKMHNVSIQIVSVAGNILQTVNKGNTGAGTYSIPLNMNVSPGIYVVKLIIDGKVYSKNVLK